MGKPSKKYLMNFKKYRNNPDLDFYSLFSDMVAYKKFVKKPNFDYHSVTVPCLYIDCPVCQGDLK